MYICQLCDARCCKLRVITITIFDVIKIKEKTSLKEDKFCELRKANLLNLDPNFILECKEGSLILTLKSQPCVFLEGKKCSIYRFAPTICRAYPFVERRRIKTSICPSYIKPLFIIRGIEENVLKRFKIELREYKNIVYSWNEEVGKRGTKKECMEFLLREGRKRFRSLERLFKDI